MLLRWVGRVSGTMEVLEGATAAYRRLPWPTATYRDLPPPTVPASKRSEAALGRSW